MSAVRAPSRSDLAALGAQALVAALHDAHAYVETMAGSEHVMLACPDMAPSAAANNEPAAIEGIADVNVVYLLGDSHWGPSIVQLMVSRIYGEV